MSALAIATISAAVIVMVAAWFTFVLSERVGLSLFVVAVLLAAATPFVAVLT